MNEKNVEATSHFNNMPVPHMVGHSPCAGLNRHLGLQGFEVPRISRQSAHEGGKVVSPKHRLPLPSRRYSRYSFLLEAKATQGS